MEPAFKLVSSGCPGLGGLVVDSGRLFATSSRDGRVVVDDGGALSEWTNTSGMPVGISADAAHNIVVADAAHGAVLQLNDEGGATVLVNEYEGQPLRGPRALAFDAAGSLFFTDAGPDGDTGLHNRAGSVFVITGEGASRILRPLALRCLANPSALALAPGDSAVFVAEAAENRVLRFTQRPPGVWHGAVFFTFSGRLGPSALATDAARSLLYVARPESPDAGARGVISVLSMDGVLLKEFETPGADVSAIALAPGGNALFVGDAASGQVLSIVL